MVRKVLQLTRTRCFGRKKKAWQLLKPNERGAIRRFTGVVLCYRNNDFDISNMACRIQHQNACFSNITSSNS
jgi:hypothetical protein